MTMCMMYKNSNDFLSIPLPGHYRSVLLSPALTSGWWADDYTSDYFCLENSWVTLFVSCISSMRVRMCVCSDHWMWFWTTDWLFCFACKSWTRCRWQLWFFSLFLIIKWYVVLCSRTVLCSFVVQNCIFPLGFSNIFMLVSMSCLLL